jgi:hypothetical protein
MGMQAEFNWYVVIKDNNLTEPEDVFILRERELDMTKVFHFCKSDYRIYPMDTPLPLIYNGKCLAMVSVTSLQWNCNKTHFMVHPVMILNEDDSVAQYYENSFKEYKQEQQSINDGGKVDLRNVVNPAVRKRFNHGVLQY